MSHKISASPFIFFFQPFVAFLLALKNLRNKWNSMVFVAFTMLFGYAMSFTYTPSDSYRIAASFCAYPIHDISNIALLWSQGKLVDFYMLLLNYVIHLFSDNPKVFYAFIGLMYGIFCCLSVRLLIKERMGKQSSYLTIIMFLFFTTASLANMSMPRFWTAVWIFFYSAVHVLKGKNRWFVGAGVSTLFHFSFLAPVLILVAYKILFSICNLNLRFLFRCMCVTFILSFCLNEQILQYVIPTEVLGDNEKLQAKVTAYVGEPETNQPIKSLSAYRQANNMVTTLFQLLMKVGAFGLLYSIVRRFKCLKIDSFTRKLLIFTIMFASGVFVLSIIRGVGWRYVWLLWLFILYLLYRVYDLNRETYWRNWIKILVPLNTYNIAFMFYLTYRAVDMLLFCAPLPVIIYDGLDFGPVYFVN